MLDYAEGNGFYKQRDLRYILPKVARWRQLYLGCRNNQGVLERYNQEDAARMVGLKKKSLADYYRWLKRGRKLGFDFENNLNCTMGVLRDFVNNVLKEERLKDASNEIQDSE